MSLKKDLFSGVFYTAVARYSGLIVSLVIAGVLARLIPPEDFGVVAVATVIISFFGIFSDLGSRGCRDTEQDPDRRRSVEDLLVHGVDGRVVGRTVFRRIVADCRVL